MSEESNKVAIITGASNEVSQEIAKELAKKGTKIILADKDKEKLEAAANEIKSAGADVLAIECDVKSADQVKDMIAKTVEKFGKVDFLINNDWTNKPSSFLDMTENIWDEVIDTNLRGPFNCCRETVPLMKKQKFGRIVNIASVTGYTGSISNIATNDVHFSTSQGALLGFTRCMSSEVGRSKITANVVVLGFMDYPSLHDIYEPRAIKSGKALITVGKMGTPEDAAAAVMFLLSDEAKFVNGETMLVCGGGYMR